MTNVQKTRNLFEFDKSEIDICELEKTACFYCPSENGGENSFSTQMTDDHKETSLPATPEQNGQEKPKVKVYTVKRKVGPGQKSRLTTIHNPLSQQLVVPNFRETLAQFIPVPKSDAETKFSHVKSLPVLNSVVIEDQLEETGPVAVNQETLADSLEIKDCLVTEADQPSEDNQLSVNFQNTAGRTSFYKSNIFNQTNSDWKAIAKDNFIIRKTNRNRIQIRNLSSVKPQNPVPDSQKQISPRDNEVQSFVMKNTLKLGKTKKKSLCDFKDDINTTSEYNLFKNARPLEPLRIGNFSNQAQGARNQMEVPQKKVVTFFSGNQEDKPGARNVVAPKLIATGTSVVKFNIVRKKEVPQTRPEQNIEIRPFSLLANSEIGSQQKEEGAPKEGIYVVKAQQERPKSRFKTQEVILSRLFNQKNQ